MKGVGGIRALALAVALGTRGFSGAQASAMTADLAAPINFDPWFGQRRGGSHRKSKSARRQRGLGGRGAFCGAKQCRKYAANPLAHDYHADRMAWLAQPRIQAVIAKREADQERAGR